VHVTIINSGCNPKIWIPNVFTPSLEGNNLFRVVSDNVTEMTVSIYRRQGDWICSFDGLTEGWDGTKEGRRCPEGTYVYFIRYKTHCLSRPKSITGTVTVIY
jgi:gliding motility-associated-like protein